MYFINNLEYKLKNKAGSTLATFNVTFSQSISCHTKFNMDNKNAYNGFINCTKNAIAYISFNQHEIHMDQKQIVHREFKVNLEQTSNSVIMNITFYPPEDTIFQFNYFFQNKHWHASNFQGVFSMFKTSKKSINLFVLITRFQC